jgi:hypothetical protein
MKMGTAPSGSERQPSTAVPATPHPRRRILDTGVAVAPAVFILDALDPLTDDELSAAADDLVTHLTRLGPDVRAVRRLIPAGPTPENGA